MERDAPSALEVRGPEAFEGPPEVREGLSAPEWVEGPPEAREAPFRADEVVVETGGDEPGEGAFVGGGTPGGSARSDACTDDGARPTDTGGGLGR
jgi:hypothetical protein